MRRRTYRFIAVLLSAAVIFPILGGGAAEALISTTQPQLTFNRLIRTSPPLGSTTRLQDNEGSAYVASDDALWMASDNDDAVFEFDRTTGVERRKVAQSAFINAPRYGVGGTAGQARTEDLEALAYDANADVIYAFSGSTSATPTAFRLTRDANHQFQVQSWQPLPSEWTGAGWRLADGLTYVANGSTIRTYDFATNTFGPSFSISGLSKIFGLDFDDVTGDLLAVNNKQRLYRASMATRTLLPGWNGISLTGFGLLDTRAVEVIGEQVFVTDGADSGARPTTDPMSHAVFVLDVTGPGGAAPTASFTATPTTGTAPLTVNFTDTSTGGPTSWAWTFGDGGTSTLQSPSHQYTTAGTYTATLVATNGQGPSAPSSPRTITVNLPSAPTASFTATPTTGTAPLTVNFTDTSTGGPTSWAWTFGDGGTSTLQSPSHQYTTAGTYTATLVATNGQGPSAPSSPRTITVNLPSAPTASFTATPTTGTAPLTVNFTDTSTGGPTSWAWTFGDGGTSTLQSPSHQYTTAGTYTATLIATNGQGPSAPSSPQTITVNAGADPVHRGPQRGHLRQHLEPEQELRRLCVHEDPLSRPLRVPVARPVHPERAQRRAELGEAPALCHRRELQRRQLVPGLEQLDREHGDLGQQARDLRQPGGFGRRRSRWGPGSRSI